MKLHNSAVIFFSEFKKPAIVPDRILPRLNILLFPYRSENMFEDETSKVVQRHVAMSRVGDTKQYVQDLLLRDQTFVYDVIANRKGHIYLCGKVIIFKI